MDRSRDAADRPRQWAAPYCVPAQLSVPLALRWLLVWEDPAEEVLWLCRAAPRDWFTDGRVVAAERVPSRWGPVAFRIESRLGRDRVEVALDLPPTGPVRLVVRLRLPGDRSIRSAEIIGRGCVTVDPGARR